MRKGELARPHRRRRRADRLRLLAAGPGRQAPQRPLHPATPPAQGHSSTSWLATRPDGPALQADVLLEHGRPVEHRRVSNACGAQVAQAAGLEEVSPHQLRHTLATQAINRGMSLEAIAALLGHRSLSMTLVYARIADRTVADEYFAVSEKVEALYDQPRALPADAEGTEMAKLRKRDAPAHARQRLLRPPGRARLPLRVDLRSLHASSSPPSSSGPPCSANLRYSPRS